MITQEQDRESAQQLATTAAVVVALKGQLGAKDAQAASLERQVAALKEDYRRSTVQLDDQARALLTAPTAYHCASSPLSEESSCMLMREAS